MKKLRELISKLFSWFKILPLFIKLIIIAGLVGFSWFGYSRFKNSSSTAPQYITAKAEKGTIVSSVSASGQVLSVNVIGANTKASGIVKKVYVKDGDKVKKGDKIMEINLDFQGQQQYSQAWSSYLSAKISLQNTQDNEYALQADLFNKWNIFKNLAENSTYTNPDGSPNTENRQLPEFIIAHDNWLTAEANYKMEQSQVAQSRTSLNSAYLNYLQSSPVVTAPADGTITSLMYVEGMGIGSLNTGTSTSNQQVATVQTEGTPVVSVNLSEIDVSKVQVGQKATVTLDSIPDKTFTGSVAGADRIGGTTSGVTQYPAIVKLDLSSPEILPNMSATANIVVATKTDVVVVPSGAVETNNGQSYVNTLQNGKSQLVPVETGISSDTQTEIKSGVSSGETVITGTQNSNSSTSQSSSSSPFGVRSFGGGGGGFRVRD